ncbi:NAD-dependent epimerase/dehydratase family protein [Sulfidibacter corallicola]|uniref:NAD-dependent epimerase/dehydratase family protein n=1 Tax=Sulfidibacter corallicola TaxID=2818388 RepID=A0A8A4TX96_SULCO|nr:NAD-dependent epimerase/dehydratase family protein [Sulfidibacter corallicola]QTD53957.1 NAD-dependent epimerase/dehydratase family protein [Sulfidibacter corallicola]
MNIMVTGIAGFIGFHCAQRLLNEGHRVLGIDNLNDYYAPALKEARLQRLQRFEKLSFEKLDLCNGEALSDRFAKFRPDRVLHLAGQVGVRYSLEHPHAYAQSNVVGTLNLLECCRHHGRPRLVYASSSSVYGGNTKLPFSESDSVDHPISLYAATKKSTELMAHAYTHLYGFSTVGLRFFTVYGPWGRPDMAVWLFTKAILQGAPIKVFNQGKMSRDFTYIDDIIAGVHAALFSEDLEPYEIFNLGNHQSQSLDDLIECIESACGREAKREFQPLQDGDMVDTFADIERARAKLKFEPSVPLKVGVPRFVSWLLANPEFQTL